MVWVFSVYVATRNSQCFLGRFLIPGRVFCSDKQFNPLHWLLHEWLFSSRTCINQYNLCFPLCSLCFHLCMVADWNPVYEFGTNCVKFEQKKVHPKLSSPYAKPDEYFSPVERCITSVVQTSRDPQSSSFSLWVSSAGSSETKICEHQQESFAKHSGLFRAQPLS